jgi:hypothetical protein
MKGASFVGLLHDISAGGLSVLLDGHCFIRGTAVVLEQDRTPALDAWVCHTTQVEDGWRVGLSLSPLHDEQPEHCWEPELCRDGCKPR